MKIFVTAKTGKKKTRVVKIDSSHYIVHVTARPVTGKANAAIVEALARCFSVAPSHIRLTKGYSCKEKILEMI